MTTVQDTQRALAAISKGEGRVLEELLGVREAQLVGDGLDRRTAALVQVAALIALDAPPSSYAWHVATALEAGATEEDILGVMRAIALQVGAPKVVAAAPEIMLALGLPLPEGEA